MFKFIKKAQNSRIDPIVHTGTFIAPGLVSYKDVKGGMCLLKKETIDEMLNSIIGIPVVIGHPPDGTKGDDLKKLQKGVVIGGRFNTGSGEFEAQFINTDSEAEDKVKKGYSLSVAYNDIKNGPGGVYHAIPYHQEILGGKFTHLAIVEARTARYEEAYIDTGLKVFQNSIGEGSVLTDKPKQEDKSMLKFKFHYPITVEHVENSVDPEKTFVDVGGKKVSVKALVAAFNSKAPATEKTEEVAEDATIEIKNAKGDTVSVAVKDLVEAFNASAASDDEDAKKKKADEEKEEEEFKNSLDEKEKEDYAKMDQEKKNCFKAAKNAKKEVKNSVELKNSKGETVAVPLDKLIEVYNAMESSRDESNLKTFQLINSKGRNEVAPPVVGTKDDGSRASGAKRGQEYFGKMKKFAGKK
jgi:hypothetical protein